MTSNPEDTMKRRMPLLSRSTSAEKNVLRFQFEVVKSYLYLLREKRIIADGLSVSSLYAMESPHNPRPKQITVSDGLGGKFYRLLDSIVVAQVVFEGREYHVSLFSQMERFGSVEFYIHLLGQEDDSHDAGKLLDVLMTESVACSPHRNMTLRATSERGDGETLELMEMEIREDSMEDVFLPESTLCQVRLFAAAVANYRDQRKAVRFLFSGKPGTGKTKLIRAIARLCQGKATFIFSSGSEDKIGELFEISGLFSPVVICIDDIDLVTGDREEGVFSKNLATLLQHLDGFGKSDCFVLATTNDKRLVDLAASRPGRFDRIIDVSVIAPELYPALVSSKTKDRKILSLFDGDIIERFRKMQATGAFVANVVKHAELMAAFDPGRLNREYILASIDESERGFSQVSGSGSVGFRAA
jgi:hypothetical protein